MKKIVFCLMVACLTLTVFPFQSKAENVPAPSAMVDPKPAESAEVKALELRLNAINSMDKTKMKASEKKALRKEVRSIDKKMRELGGVVYISGAAVVLIIILLIVLL
jgi:hypothetical protein